MEKILSAVVALLLLSLPFQHAHASPAHVPQTGQTICYDQFGNSINCTGTGQDGETRTGIAWPNPRFRDNGLVDSADQTMTDMLTGLAWAKNANAASAPKTWQQALDYVNSLNDQNYLGHSDWRLPNVNELSSISGQQGSNGAWLTGQGFVNIQAGFYWSSTSSASTPSTAWIVDIANGNINGTYKTTPLYVWPVRSDATGAAALLLARTGQTGCWNTSGTGRSCAGTGEDGELQAGAAWPTPRFAAGTDETITDTLTGLTWSGNAAPSAVPTWQQALQHIATLNSDNYLGHTDWRLPNVNELSSLFDFQQGNAAAWLAAQGFVNVQTGNYWTSTSYADAPRFAWYVYMASGGSDYDRKATPNDAYYVWPVRGGFTGSVVHLGVAREGSGSGTVTPDTGSIAWKGTNGTGDYTRGSVVTLTATPDMGSAFAGWSGACSGPGSCMVTLDEARSVTATFVTPTILPSPWNFGDVAVYTEARKAFTISNNGLSPLSVTAITITGTNPTQFGIIPGNCATLPPASSCTVDVTFYPTTQGPKNALLHVTTDSAANPVLEAQLSGIGIIPYYALSVNTEGTGSGRVYFSS